VAALLVVNRKANKCLRSRKSVSGNGVDCQISVTIAVTKNCRDIYLNVSTIDKELLSASKIYTDYPQKMMRLEYVAFRLFIELGKSSVELLSVGYGAGLLSGHAEMRQALGLGSIEQCATASSRAKIDASSVKGGFPCRQQSAS
jgi:hypothetical protein